MPFRSERQRRYLWKHHPTIARRWSKTYGSGVRRTKAKRRRRRR